LVDSTSTKKLLTVIMRGLQQLAMGRRQQYPALRRTEAAAVVDGTGAEAAVSGTEAEAASVVDCTEAEAAAPVMQDDRLECLWMSLCTL